MQAQDPAVIQAVSSGAGRLWYHVCVTIQSTDVLSCFMEFYITFVIHVNVTNMSLQIWPETVCPHHVFLQLRDSEYTVKGGYYINT